MRPARKTFDLSFETTREGELRVDPERGAHKRYSSLEEPEIQLLDEQEVSRRLSVSVNTLRYWRACGDGPNYVKLGRLVRYDAAALEKFILRNLRVSKARATAEEKRVAL
jgi:predicted DNA-binding transcriptional regulator AlpA